ncbi:MAG: GNAT family N-acetyltransferase [Thermoplasmata archaeon]|nr:GNAT family N-acetyltransferase [Thermoplasmata archaeon]
MSRPVFSIDAAMDRRWLEEQARHDPFHHAYALWDLQQAPLQVEFRLLREAGIPVAYLLIWRGTPGQPVVHWVGSPAATDLVDQLPPRPLIAVVPEELRARVTAARGPTTSYGVLLMAHDRRRAVEAKPREGVRRLRADDYPAVRRFADAEANWLLRGYTTRPPSDDAGPGEIAWAAFEGERIVGVARAQVRLPDIWILGGIYVASTHRRQGLGRALTAVATAAAESAGARCALYVREDNQAARSVYDALGYTILDRRLWIDAGVERAP